MANPNEIEPLGSYIATDDMGAELLLMLFPEGWVCISVCDDHPDAIERRYSTTFVRLESLTETMRSMEELNGS